MGIGMIFKNFLNKKNNFILKNFKIKMEYYESLNTELKFIDQKYEIKRLESKIKDLEYEQCKMKVNQDYPEKYSDEYNKAYQKCFSQRWN